MKFLAKVILGLTLIAFIVVVFDLDIPTSALNKRVNATIIVLKQYVSNVKIQVVKKIKDSVEY